MKAGILTLFLVFAWGRPAWSAPELNLRKGVYAGQLEAGGKCEVRIDEFEDGVLEIQTSLTQQLWYPVYRNDTVILLDYDYIAEHGLSGYRVFLKVNSRGVPVVVAVLDEWDQRVGVCRL